MKIEEQESGGAIVTCDCGNKADITPSMLKVIRTSTGEIKCTHCYKVLPMGKEDKES